jgi:glutamate racemase
MNRYSSIGVFDSGIGGLSVVKRISAYLPCEDIIYFGDTARVPYGTKSNETVIEYAKQDAQFLIKRNVKLIIVACNTVSSVAIDILRKTYKIPIIGMIEPGSAMAAQITKNKKIGVIGTNTTINNKAYSKELLKIDPTLEVYEKACPLFVPLAEEGWINHKATTLIAKEYLTELKEKGIDTLILGCTHYPLLADIIQKVMGNKVTLIDSGQAATKVVDNYLAGRGLKTPINQEGRHEYYVSDLPEKFKNVAEMFLGKKINNIYKVDPEELTTE